MSEWYDKIGPSRILDNLWLSGYKAAADLWESNPAGITHVLDVSTNDPYLEAEGIDYCHVPFHDGEPIPPKQFAACLAFLQFANDNDGKILVHCAAGISRSPTIVASWMHYSKQMPFSAALQYVMSKRPIVNPAIVTMNSARKLLRTWPYDGSMVEEPEHEKLIRETVTTLIIKEATKYHPDPNCPVRVAMEEPHRATTNIARHTIKCTCR